MKATVSNVGLAASAVLCVVSTFLPWITSGGSGTNAYDSYFSGTPEALIIASVVVLAAAVFSMIKHNKATRILGGVLGVIAALVVAGMSVIIYMNDRGGMSSINSYSMSSLNISTNGFISIGLGNYLAMLSAAVMLVFSILALVSGKSGKKAELETAEA